MITPELFLKLCKQKNDKGFEEVKSFIESGGKFKLIKDKSDISPLHLAVKSNSIKIVKLLLDNGMNPMIRDKTNLEKTPIVDALDRDLVDITLLLLQAKNFKPLKAKNRYNETTALGNSTISISDYKKIVEEFVKVGIDFELTDFQNQTLLTKAIKNRQIDRIKICLNYGLNPNNNDINALSIAFYNDIKDIKIVKLLLDNGAKLVIDNGINSFNALHASHIYDDPESFGLLINEYNALETIDDETLQHIIEYKEISFLKYLWEIPKVQNFILQHNLEEAFPKEARDVFVF